MHVVLLFFPLDAVFLFVFKYTLLLFSYSVSSDSLRPHGLQHARLLYPSPSPRACSNSCPLSWWCHPTISSSVVPFSSCLQSSPASGLYSNESTYCCGGWGVEGGGTLDPDPVSMQSKGWIHPWLQLGEGLLTLKAVPGPETQAEGLWRGANPASVGLGLSQEAVDEWLPTARVSAQDCRWLCWVIPSRGPLEMAKYPFAGGTGTPTTTQHSPGHPPVAHLVSAASNGT